MAREKWALCTRKEAGVEVLKHLKSKVSGYESTF